MVVMIVADEDEVDPGQVLAADPRCPHPLWADEGERRGALGPDRVGEDVDALRLNEDRGVADPGDEHLLAVDPARRHRRRDRYLLRPLRSLIGADEAVHEA